MTTATSKPRAHKPDALKIVSVSFCITKAQRDKIRRYWNSNELIRKAIDALPDEPEAVSK